MRASSREPAKNSLGLRHCARYQVNADIRDRVRPARAVTEGSNRLSLKIMGDR